MKKIFGILAMLFMMIFTNLDMSNKVSKDAQLFRDYTEVAFDTPADRGTNFFGCFNLFEYLVWLTEYLTHNVNNHSPDLSMQTFCIGETPLLPLGMLIYSFLSIFAFCITLILGEVSRHRTYKLIRIAARK